MSWLWEWLVPQQTRPQDDREAFERREAQLRERLERLERLTDEVDTTLRSQEPERPWP